MHPYESENPRNETFDEFNKEIMTQMDWGSNKGDITKSARVLPKPRQPHPIVKYSPLSPRQKKERSFLTRLMLKDYKEKFTDPSQVKKQWNKSVLK